MDQSPRNSDTQTQTDLKTNYLSTSKSNLRTSLFSNDHSEQSEWNEQKASTLVIGNLPSSERKTPYHFHFLFCLFRRKNLQPLAFLRYFFNIEITIACIAVIGSLIALLYGITYFSIDPQFDRDNQLIGLTCGVSGMIFSIFKFYFTLISLNAIKKEIFVPEIACAAGLSVLTHAILVVVSIIFTALAIFVGMNDYDDGKSKDPVEFDFGILLIIGSFPMVLLTLVIVGQSFLMRKVGRAVDDYMLEYIHSSRVRRQKREQRRRKRAREMRDALGRG